MQCPKCSFIQPDPHSECLRCGIVFKKYHRRPVDGAPVAAIAPGRAAKAAGLGAIIKELLFYVKPEIHPLIFAGRLVFWLVILVWGFKLIFTPLQTNYAGESFWHLVNLPFHEFGHIIFRPFGRLMTSLGGSLAQVLMPLVCLAVFILKTRDPFAASFTLWWAGESLIDLAPYINDARSLTLLLVGGHTGRTSPYGYHDWEFILKETALIRSDHTLAGCAHHFGAVVMIIACLWGGYLLYRQSKNLICKG